MTTTMCNHAVTAMVPDACDPYEAVYAIAPDGSLLQFCGQCGIWAAAA